MLKSAIPISIFPHPLSMVRNLANAGINPSVATTTPDKEALFVILKNPAAPPATRGFPFLACGLGCL